MLRLAVPTEHEPRERRVALVPNEVSRLATSEIAVTVADGAGAAAGFSDEAYSEAGAEIAKDPASLMAGADMIVKVRAPSVAEVEAMPEGAKVLSFLPPAAHLDTMRAMAGRKMTAFSFDLVPRTSRAQSMDALSSQASLAGYQAVLVAGERLAKMFPMMMTAAGTIPPAKVLVMGAGVAGLQAIATARRLGASVSAYDVRPAAADEVRSLGAKFVELPLEAATGEGGYAAEQSEDFQRKQQALVADTVASSDVVITTAAIPGRPAPRLLSSETVERMKPGSVVVDLAAASGGNCELTVDGEEILHGGVLIIGAGDLPSGVAANASSLYARNVSNLVGLLARDGELVTDFDDDIVAATCVVAAGDIRHQPTRDMVEGGTS